jgi:enediyne polyketide synthase
VRELICAKAELPAEAVGEGSRLLADLHLNSISVGEILVAAARRMGVLAPSAPTDYARATVGEVAEAFASRLGLAGVAGHELRGGDPPGVATWIRTFRPSWVPRERLAESRSAGSSEWQVVAEPGDLLASSLGLRSHDCRDLPEYCCLACGSTVTSFRSLVRRESCDPRWGHASWCSNAVHPMLLLRAHFTSAPGLPCAW